MGCSIVVLYRPALERSGPETETSAHRWSALFAYCSAATPMIFLNYWYTMLTPFVEDVSRVSKSDATAATLWLTLGNVGGGVPSSLMATAMALARAQALV
jgi:hypothetical protein